MTRTAADSASYHVATFYKFVELADVDSLKREILEECRAHALVGTVLLAREGINGTLSGAPADLNAVIDFLRADPRMAGLPCRFSTTDSPPFKRMKVRTRPEIVTLGDREVDPESMRGTYVDPADWNALISRDDVVVIDARNDYEVAIGTFAGARDPGTERFSDLPGWLESQPDLESRPPVAMFCTGGIRCEKSTAYLRRLGFDRVYHLEGGILNYLASIPEDESLFEGECFVFDERVALTHGLRRGSHRLCDGCGRPVPRDGDAGPAHGCPNCRE